MHSDDTFTPENVDEQVDQLLSHTQDESQHSDFQVIQGLHALYEEDQRSTERVWERLARQVAEYDNDAQQPEISDGLQQGEIQPVQQTPRFSKSRKPSWLMTIAAVLFAALLVSSLLWTLHIVRSHQVKVVASPTAGIVSPTASSVTNSPSGIYVNAPDGLSKLDSQTRQVIWHASTADKQNNTPDEFGSPLVVGNTVIVYFSSYDVTTLNTYGRILAFNAETGAPRWSRAFTYGFPRAIWTPLQADGLIYVWENPGYLYTLNPTSGDFTTVYQPSQGTTVGSTIISNNILYYADSTQHLYALQLPGAKLLWQQQFIPEPWSDEPVIIAVANGAVYVSDLTLQGTPHHVFAFDAHTGAQIWQSPELGVGKGADYQMAATNDMIYVSAYVENGNLYAFDAHTHKLVWLKHIGSFRFVVDSGVLYVTAYNPVNNQMHENLMALNASNGSVLWQKPFTLNYYEELNILEIRSGVLYLIGCEGVSSNASGPCKVILYALKSSDGSLLWQWQSGVEPKGPGITVV